MIHRLMHTPERSYRLVALCPLLLIMAVLLPIEAAAVDKGAHRCVTGIGVKTNLIHDIVLTPDLGVELNFHNRFSVSVEGVWAWWSCKSRHRYWRIYGGWLEGRYWLGIQSDRRVMTGHHLGLYTSIHTYDFEFGGKGYQAPDAVWGIGIGYGYSFPISRRLDIDVGIRAGYSSGKQTTYRPQCGEYICLSTKTRRYFGLTDLTVSLIWIIGENKTKSP